MSTTIAERSVLFAVAASTVALLHIFGKLSLDSSIVLGGLFTLLGLWLWMLKLLASRPAYRIVVTLNNQTLSTAFGLVSNGINAHQSVSFICIRPGVFVEETGGRFSSGVSFKQKVPINRLASAIEDDHQELQIELLRGAVYTFVGRLSYPLLVNPNRVSTHDLNPYAETGTFVLGTLPLAYFPEPDINSVSKLEFGAMFTTRKTRNRQFQELGWNITEEYNHLWNEYFGVTYSRF